MRAATSDRRPSEGWLDRLYALLNRNGVPVATAAARGGILRLKLAESDLEIEVREIAEDEECYGRTERFGITYRGTDAVQGNLGKRLQVLLYILGRIEHRLPDTLHADTAVGEQEGPDVGKISFTYPFVTVEKANSLAGDDATSEALIRLTERCNQACSFCSAPRELLKADWLPDPSDESVERCIEMLLETLPNPCITLTGGEPTLRKGMVDLVERVLNDKRAALVKVQTNAVFFSNPKRLESWPKPSARLVFFVSFHSADERIYDEITDSRGLFDKAVRGIRNLLDAGHNMVLNAVVTRHNASTLTETVEQIPVLFPGSNKPKLHFSITMCPEDRPEAQDCVAPYSEVSPALEAAVARAEALGLTVDPLLSSSHASIPACLVSEENRQGTRMLPVIRPDEYTVEGEDKPWVKAKRCEECTYNSYCLGLPLPYVKEFGLGELRPI
jgi:organic radical activating enzyme